MLLDDYVKGNPTLLSYSLSRR